MTLPIGTSCLHRNQVVHHPQNPQKRMGCRWFHECRLEVLSLLKKKASMAHFKDGWTCCSSPVMPAGPGAQTWPNAKEGPLLFLTQISLERIPAVQPDKFSEMLTVGEGSAPDFCRVCIIKTQTTHSRAKLTWGRFSALPLVPVKCFAN